MWAKRVTSVDELSVARSLSAEPGFAWLDSNRSESRDGRYSFLMAWPDEEVRADFGAPEPFAGLRSLTRRGTARLVAGLEPSEVPEWVGYIAYDAFWSAPARGTPRFERPATPVLLFRRYPALVAIDHADGTTWIVGDDEDTCEIFGARLRQSSPGRRRVPMVGPLTVDDPGDHREAILAALRFISQGDVYEVNVARRWTAPFSGDAVELWKAMRVASRVPLGMYFDGGDHAVLACTMERFLRWDATDHTLVTRPIKGTIRREPTDDGASERLRADPKEQAEHSMIVDLMRNDLGRVAEIGTVTVEEPLMVEPFTGLYHLVSTVRCRTRADVGLAEVLDATFPPGSVTGAPKIRALEIIEALEAHPREVYCGAVGFIDRLGGLSLAVAIRTATVRAGRVTYWAGGGIVEASDPDREVAETELKARVFLDAVELLEEQTDE